MSLFAMQQTNSFSARELSNRNSLLKNSIHKLSSGTRLANARDDSGMLSVKMKMETDLYKNSTSMSKIANAVSFLNMQDGILDNAQSILMRMSQLKALGTNDPMKSEQDIDTYNNEFQDLQRQLFLLSRKTFNNASLFSTTAQIEGGNEVRFKGTDQEKNSITVQTTSSDISLQKLPLLAALTVRANDNSLQVIDDPTYGTGYDSNGNEIIVGSPDGNWSANGGNALRTLASSNSGLADAKFITAESGGTPDNTGAYWDSYKTTFDLNGFESPIFILAGGFSYHGGGREIKINGDLITPANGGVFNTWYPGLNEIEMNIKRVNGKSAVAVEGLSISAIPTGEFILNTRYSDRLNKIGTIALGVESEISLSNLNNVPMSYLNQALENLSYLRSQASATSSRLKFINDIDHNNKSLSSDAYGRISGVDYAKQSTFLAKQQIMVSATAAMIAQANSMGDVLLTMLN